MRPTNIKKITLKLSERLKNREEFLYADTTKYQSRKQRNSLQ